MKRFPQFLAPLISLILCLLLSSACRRRITQTEVKVNLERALTRQLQENNKNANSPHFEVLDVEWFEEPTDYRCEFKVKMTLPNGMDTTGIMKKKVSKDFYTVQ